MNPLSHYCQACGSNLIVAQHTEACPNRPQPNPLYAEIDRPRTELAQARLDQEYWKAKAQRPALNSTKA